MTLRFFYDEWQSFVEFCGFTDDELEIVKYIRKGWAGIDIAAELCISLSTLNRRKKSISQKIARYISKN